MLSSTEVIKILKLNLGELKAMKVKRLGLFGSRARGDTSSHSDFDFLVEFSTSVTFDLFFDLKHFLEDHLGGPIDLVTIESIRPALRPYIDKDLIEIV
jgi:predicted nucleotidyltransferase